MLPEEVTDEYEPLWAYTDIQSTQYICNHKVYSKDQKLNSAINS